MCMQLTLVYCWLPNKTWLLNNYATNNTPIIVLVCIVSCLFMVIKLTIFCVTKVVIRPMMYVALTYDHRLVDGREAVMFLRKIKAAVEDPRVVLAGL